MRRTGVDGFNLAYAVLPETFADVVAFLVSELRAWGAYKTEYAAGTWRGAWPMMAPELDDAPALAGRVIALPGIAFIR